MRKLCACLLVSGLMVIGCNKPSSSGTSGRTNAGAGAAAGHNENTGRTSQYGPTGTQHGATGANGGVNPQHGAAPSAVIPPAPGTTRTPGNHAGEANTGATNPTPAHQGENTPPEANVPPTALGGAPSPEQFATRAWQGDAAEVKLAKLAEQNGKSQAVKDFAQHMIQDHSKANEQLGTIMKANNWNMPEGLNQKDQREYDRLSKLKGQEFDRAYMQQMLQDHEHDIQLFQQEARSGKDAKIQGWAKKTLPVLEQHLKMAQDAAKELGITVPRKQL